MKGQLSVEFFLIMAFLFALAVVLFVTTESQAHKAQLLDKAVLSRSALDSFENSVDRVFFEGNGSRDSIDLFVPQNSVCFIPNATGNYFECDADPEINGRVFGRVLYADVTQVFTDTTCPPSSSSVGWIRVESVSNGTSVLASCSSLS